MAVALEVLTSGGAWSSRARETVSDVAGAPVAELSLAPLPLIARELRRLRDVATEDDSSIALRMNAAADAFLTETIAGLDYESYLATVARVSGLGITTVRAAADKLARTLRAAADIAGRARPRDSIGGWSEPAAAKGGPRWARRGSTFAVLTAGNHPGTHGAWLQAVALGYRVAVRPSRKEPFTPHRLVSALRDAGIPQVVLLPSEHGGVDEMIGGADLAMVYGGDDVMRRFAARPTLLPQGPGRSKVLVTAGSDREAALDLATDSIAHGGGTSCTNATAVLVEDDPRGFGIALAERLGRLTPLDPLDDRAVLPVVARADAERWDRTLRQLAAGAERLTGGSAGRALDAERAALGPVVHLLPSASDPRRQLELPFANAWVAPWSPDDDVEPLRETLVLTAVTNDERLLDRLVDEPTIRNVYAGGVPTYWTAPGVPHDGFLSDFLMESKGVRRVVSVTA